MTSSAPRVLNGPPLSHMELTFEIQQFLFREARLLDEQDYDSWFEMLADDLHYWAPGIQSRYRRDKSELHSPTRMAHFDDTKADIVMRCLRWKEDSAWSEDPPTRHCHFVTNVEVEATADPNEWRVHSLIISLRNRNEDEEYWLGARRDDILRFVEGGFLVARRKIIFTQSVLLSKNMNTFF